MKLFFSLAMAWALPLAVNAATVSFSGITSTNAVKTNDLLLVDSALGGTNYATRTALISTVVSKSIVTNSLALDGDTNKFVNGAGHLSQIYNVVTNYTLSGTNGITVTGTTNGTNVTILVGVTNVVAKSGDTMTGTLGFSGTSTLLNLPSLTTAQKGAATAQAGSLVYDSDLGRVQAYDGAAWHSRVRLDGDTMTGALTVTNGTITTDTPAISIGQVYNNSTNTFTTLRLNVTDTASASGSLLEDLQVGGISQFSVRKNGIASVKASLVCGANVGLDTTTLYGTQLALGSGFGTDCILLRDGAANTLAQRNGANAQTFRVYNTYTDASNYERAVVGWSGNVFLVQTEAAGTGAVRGMYVGPSGNSSLYLYCNGSARWALNGSGHLTTASDNAYDIGANGSTRPRSVYIGTSVTAPLTLSPNLQSGNTKVLTSTTAADFLYIAVPNTNMIGGRVLWTINATDGTDSQQQTGSTMFGAVGKGTAVTAGLTTTTNAAVVSAGTLTAALAANVTTNNVFALGVTATTSLTTTNLVLKWRLETPGTYTVNPL